MPNPLWTLWGSLEVPPGIAPDALLDRIEEELAGHGKRVFDRDGPAVTFTSYFWEDVFGLNGNALMLYDRGRLWLDGGGGTLRLRWELRSPRVFILCLAVAAAAGLFSGSVEGWSEGAEVALKGLAWLYGLNLAVSLIRVPQFFRRMLR